MKKLFFLLIIGFSLLACNSKTIKNKDIPSEIMSLKEFNKFDTVLVIPTERYVYTFDTNKKYLGAYNVDDYSEPNGILLVFALIFIIVLLSILFQ